jgi:hypothetical protein
VATALVEELRHQRAQLEEQVQDLQRRHADQVAELRARLDFAERSIQAHQQGEAELRRLLAAALQQRALADGAARSRDESCTTVVHESPPWWARWWPWRR